MDDVNQPFSPGQQQYSNETKQACPIGEFRACLHVQSGQRRGLKVMRGNLAEKAIFFSWYNAALTLSGEAAEFLGLPELIAPMKTPDGKWISMRGRENVIERPFFGSEDNPAWNLAEFVNLYKEVDKGVDEDAALTVMKQVVDILVSMHSAKMPSAEGIRLTGIPHLNLKPQNVLIGKHPRTTLYEVRLTDFLVASASPLAEESGMVAPLNYSDTKILRDRVYYGLSADIFSCGLLLYRLVENQDLIPADLSRKSILEFHQTELPTRVRNLKLTKAGVKVRTIIQRCLTISESERYSSVNQLKGDIDRALKGKDATAILTDFVERKKKKRDEPPPKPIDWHRIFKRTAFVLIPLLFVALLYGFSDDITKLWENFSQRDTIASIEQVEKKLDHLWPTVSNSDCMSRSRKEQFQSIRDSAIALFAIEEYQPALNMYNSLISQLQDIGQLCNEYQKLYLRGDVVAKRQADIPEFAQIWPQFISALDSAQVFLINGDFSNTRLYLVSASSFLPALEGSAWECNWLSVENDLQKDLNRVGELCQAEAQGLLESAKIACAERDSIGFARIRAELAGFAGNARCKPFDCAGKLNDLNVTLATLEGTDCYESGVGFVQDAEVACDQELRDEFLQARQNLDRLAQKPECGEDECAEAGILVDSAVGVLSRFREKYQNVPYNRNSSYVQAVDYVAKARALQEQNDCVKAAWQAKSAINSIADVTPCTTLMPLVDSVRGCLENNIAVKEELAQQVSLIENYMAQCQCSLAMTELDILRSELHNRGLCLPIAKSEPKPIPEPPPINTNPPNHVYTFAECEERYLSGAADAWQICEQVSPDDPSYDDAMKYFVIAAGKDHQFQVSFRPRMQRAFDLSSVDHSLILENAAAYITMICVYGWEKNNLDCNRVIKYWDTVSALGEMGQNHQDWWRALLVMARCSMHRFRSNPTHLPARQEARSQARDFIRFVKEQNIQGVDPFVKEVQGYIDEIRADR